MGILTITAEAPGGADIRDCSRDAVRLAGLMGVGVRFSFNGVCCMARPGDDPALLADDYMRALHSQSDIKIAYAYRGDDA